MPELPLTRERFNALIRDNSRLRAEIAKLQKALENGPRQDREDQDAGQQPAG